MSGPKTTEGRLEEIKMGPEMWTDKFEILKNSIKVFLIAVFMALMGILLATHQALGYMATEVEPGIVELKQVQEGSFVIEKVQLAKSRKWIYVAVAEKTGLSSKLGASSGKLRYFYAPAKDFKVQQLKPKMRIEKLQYGIKRRIINAKGRIPFGNLKYFYRLLDLKTLS